MKSKSTLIAYFLVCVAAFAWFSFRTTGGGAGELTPSLGDYILLDRERTNKVMEPFPDERRTRTTLHFDDSMLAKNHWFLKLSRTGVPTVAIEILRPCEVIITPSTTDGSFRWSLRPPTFSGGLKVEVVIDGRRCFSLAADELSAQGSSAP